MDKKKVKIVEVGPRDGYQSIKCEGPIISTEIKEKYIDKIIDAGITSLQFTSFVSPKAIPQLADAKELTKRVLEEYKGLDLFALIPNMRGAEDAYNLGLRKVSYVVSFSKSHNKANINRTHEQSLQAYKEIVEKFPDLEVEVNFATAFGCPFEGKYDNVEEFIEFIATYANLGLKSFVIADTIGIADPAQVKKYTKAIRKAFPGHEISLHLHDTRGLGIANSLAALEEGIYKFETALGGLGGCPFAPGASGNVATEDLVWALEEMGYDTGIDFVKLVEASKEQAKDVRGNYSGHHKNIEKISPLKNK